MAKKKKKFKINAQQIVAIIILIAVIGSLVTPLFWI